MSYESFDVDLDVDSFALQKVSDAFRSVRHFFFGSMQCIDESTHKSRILPQKLVDTLKMREMSS